VAEPEDKELNEYQAAALKSAVDEDVVFVEHGGKRYEVRALTLADDRAVTRIATRKGKGKEPDELDGHRLTVLKIIHATYIPGTQKRVFAREHEDTLMAMRAGPNGIVAKLAKAVAKVSKVDLEEEEKNSESGPTSTSSTP
jgi:hypothetical protein